MRFDDLNWMDIEAYLEQEDRLILVLGACEQHGYLSLTTDVKIPLALADAVSQKTGILVVPPVNFGISPYFLSYPGTISLRVSTFLDLVGDMVRSIYSQGFRRLLVLNGHGGNDAVRNHLVELANELDGLKFAWYAWWLSHSVEQVANQHGIKPTHANWLEAFPFTRVGELPDEEKNVSTPRRLLNSEETRQYYQDGSFGGRYAVDSEIMEEVFAAILEDALYLAEFNE